MAHARAPSATHDVMPSTAVCRGDAGEAGTEVVMAAVVKEVVATVVVWVVATVVMPAVAKAKWAMQAAVTAGAAMVAWG